MRVCRSVRSKRFFPKIKCRKSGRPSRRCPRKKRMRKELDNYQRNPERDRWARPGMSVTFRAEIMPSRERSERTFRVTKLLPSGRVTLEGVTGEHTEHEFEPVR